MQVVFFSDLDYQRAALVRCHAQLDGDCDWTDCPQKTDYRTICPLVNREEDDR